MPKIETPATCKVNIDNKEIKHKISSVQLEQYIDRHHVLKIRVKQSGRASADSDFDDPGNYTAFLGKTVGLTITPQGGIVDPSRELEFLGLVTDVNLENSIDGLNTVLITAHSPTVTFDGSPQIKYFEDQKASDIIGSIVSNYPVNRGNIEATGDSIKYSVQYQESDYEYVMRQSETNGKFAFFDGKEFRVEKSNGSSFEELNWRESLGSFSVNLGTAPSKYASKSWEYGRKTALEGDTSSSDLQSSPSDLARISIDASDKVYGKAGYVSSMAADQSGLDSTLVKQVESQVGKMISCHGECIVPSVKVGHCVKVNGMGKLDGLFWVKEVKHYFDESGKYHNEFTSTPLDIAFPVKKIKRDKLTNLQSALVTGLEDPDGLGRIKVTIPSLGIETLWVRFLSPHAGSDHGWLVMPEIDDEVLVGFENGNPDYPIALGCLYNGQALPPVQIDDKNEEKVFLTKSGNEIRFTDTSGQEKISISTKDGDNQIVLDINGPAVSIKTKGSVNVECDGDMTLKGKNITVESQANFKVKAGANADIEANTNLTVKGNANVDVQAGAMCNVKGSMINLN